MNLKELTAVASSTGIKNKTSNSRLLVCILFNQDYYILLEGTFRKDEGNYN